MGWLIWLRHKLPLLWLSRKETSSRARSPFSCATAACSTDIDDTRAKRSRRMKQREYGRLRHYELEMAYLEHSNLLLVRSQRCARLRPLRFQLPLQSSCARRGFGGTSHEGLRLVAAVAVNSL